MSSFFSHSAEVVNDGINNKKSENRWFHRENTVQLYETVM